MPYRTLSAAWYDFCALSPNIFTMDNKLINLYNKFRQQIDLSSYTDVQAAGEQIRSNVAFRGPNIVILFCAIVIASVGLNVNSIPVIIGAMLISPLMSPIIGFGLGLGTNDTDLLIHSLKNLGIMVGISILASTLYFLVSPLDMEHPTELLARTNPTIYDVLIALFGGFAGILETSRKEKGTVMSGVAIATALMPPLCTVGYGLATFTPSYFIGALYLFSINCIFIALAAFIGTKYLDYPLIRIEDPAAERRRSRWIGFLVFVLVIPSLYSGYTVIQENNFSRNINAFVTENKNIGKSYIYDYCIHQENKPATVELFIAGEALSEEGLGHLYAAAQQHGLSHSQLTFHQEAAFAGVVLDEEEIIKNILRNNDEKLQLRDREIAALQDSVDKLNQLIQSKTLPCEQIEQEIMQQYPQVKQAILAHSDNNDLILILSSGKKSLTSSQVERLQSWLKVRLNAEQVIVMQK